MDIVEGLRSRNKALKPIITKRNEEPKAVKSQLTDEEEPLSPAARLFHEPHLNCYIIGIMGSKAIIKPDIVKAGLEKTLLNHPRFSSIQVMDENKGGQMRWLKTKVDLENHVIVPDVDRNMDSPDKFVEDYISNLSTTTIDMSKPLWDLHLINVKTTDAEAIGVFRIHHSLGDGTSLISVLLACTRKTADPDSLPTVPVKKQLVLERSSWYWELFNGMWVALQLAWNTLVDFLMIVITVGFFKDTETPLKGAPGVEFAPKRFVYRTVNLDDIKLVKKAMNMTINDVVLGVTAAGMSQYLNRRYAEEKKDGEATAIQTNLLNKDGQATTKETNLPKHIRIRATLLVNIRPSPGIQALAEMMEKEKTDAKWGNRLGYVLLPFNIRLRDDPLDYVRAAKATIDRKKRSLEAIYTFFSAALILKSMGIKAAAAISHRILSHTTMCFSNVVGPLEEIAFYGHSIAYLAPSVYGHPHVFTIHYQSYIDNMTIVLAVDQNVILDPHQLLDDLEESLKLIKEAIARKE